MSTTEQLRATGTFAIDSWDQDTYDRSARADLTRASLTKTFTGDLTGTSSVQLLGVSVPGADGQPQGAAYVAVERFTGSVRDRRGSFVLTHSAGADGATIAVVAGSATDELAGLSGRLVIDRDADGTHHYTFDYYR